MSHIEIYLNIRLSFSDKTLVGLVKKFFIFTYSVFCPLQMAVAETCATTFSELDQTDRLKTFKTLVPSEGRRGFVNKTKGSFFYLEAQNDGIEITFFTTGFLDLYGIRKQGKLKFCDNGSMVQVHGIDRIEDLKVSEAYLQFGDGTDRQLFTPGLMPEHLQKMYEKDAASVATGDKDIP